MSLPIQFVPAKRRVRRRPRRVIPEAPVDWLIVTALLGMSGAPEGVEVRLTVDATEADPVVVLADADPAKWVLHSGWAQFRGVSVAAVSFSELSVVLSQVEVETTPASLVYQANPSDIFSQSGRPLKAFTWKLE